MLDKVMISCEKAVIICDKCQYNEASFIEKMKFRFHFLFCKICKRYNKQNHTMSALFHMKCQEIRQHQPKLSEIDKAELKKKLEEHL